MVAGPQADVVIAPGYADGAVDALRKKRKNTRILDGARARGGDSLDVRQISGGFLLQAPHHFAATRNDWRVVTKVGAHAGAVASTSSSPGASAGT